MSWSDRWRGSDDSVLYSETTGNGDQTVVFLAGLGGTSRYWASRVKPITLARRVVLVDLLGFGRSPKPWTKYSVARHVTELRKVLEPLGTASLVGHSLGALLAVAYAARYPDDVRSIALVGLPVFRSQSRAYHYFRHGPARFGIVYTNVVLAMAACVVTRRVLGRVLPYLIRTLPREVAEDLVQHTWRSSTSSLWEVVYRYDVIVDLDRLPAQMGVLLIHGDRDVMAPPARVRELAERHPSWGVRIMPGVDHHPFLRDPDACLAMIEGLLNVTDPVREAPS